MNAASRGVCSTRTVLVNSIFRSKFVRSYADDKKLSPKSMEKLARKEAQKNANEGKTKMAEDLAELAKLNVNVTELDQVLKEFLTPRTIPRLQQSDLQYRKDTLLAEAFSYYRDLKHTTRKASIAAKNKLMTDALNALPEPLRNEAIKVDYTPFPMQLRLPRTTPAIPGYKPPSA